MVGAFLLFLAAVPVGYYIVGNWLCQRELDALYAEMDADDPHWRWADLAAAMPEPPPDEQNAAVQLLRVRDLLAKTPYKMTLAPPGPGKKTPVVRNARLPAATATAMRAALAKLGPAVVDEARKLKDLPEGRFRFDAADNPFYDRKPADIDIRLVETVNLLHDDALLRADDGAIEGAAESCQALLHTAHAIGDHPTLFAQLIRAAGQDQATQALERTLARGQLPKQRLIALQHALEREAEHNALYPAMRGERAGCQLCYDLIAEGKITFADIYGGFRPNRTWKNQLHDIFASPTLRGHPDRLRLMNELVTASQLPEENRLNALQAVAQRALEHPDSLTLGTAYIAGTVAELQKRQARLRCAATAVAAERYRLEHGRWPHDADELVKIGLLKKALIDPFAGQPLLWKQTPTGIAIYSLGQGGISFELWRPELRVLAAPL